MRFLLAWLLLLSAAALAAPVVAQPQPQPDLARRIGSTVADSGAPGYRFQTFRLDSADGLRHYRVRVAAPESAAPAEGFPVAYLLDGNAALMEVDAALLGDLAQSPRPPVIAFIAHDNDLRIDADARAFDYTPRRPGGEQAQQDAIGGRRNGGADAFLELIEADIAPRVAAMAKIDPARRALWGHSYGGVFVLHTLFTRPQAFSVYAPVDPSLWWGEGYLLREQEQARPTADAALWLATGRGGAGSERTPPPGRDPQAVEAMRRARQSVPADAVLGLVEREKARGVPVEHVVLDGLSHGQTLGASLPLFLRQLAEAEAPR